MNMPSTNLDQPWNLYELALYNYWKTGDDTPLLVHTNVAETEEMHPSYFFRSPSNWPEHEEEIMSLAKGKVLEIGAGVGSHALELQNRGLEIHANESAQIASQIMIERGVKNVIPSGYLDLKGEYDTILLIMNGLGMAKSPIGLIALFNQIISLLTKDGQILFDAADISHLHEEHGFMTTQYDDNYYGIVTYQFEYCGNLGKSFQWLFVDKVLLFEIAESLDLEVTILMEDRQFGYSAMLNRK